MKRKEPLKHILEQFAKESLKRTAFDNVSINQWRTITGLCPLQVWTITINYAESIAWQRGLSAYTIVMLVKWADTGRWSKSL